MKIFAFILIFFTSVAFGQTTGKTKIKNISIDSTGNLKWSVFMTKTKLNEQVAIFHSNFWDTVYSVKGLKNLITIDIGNTPTSSGYWLEQTTMIKLHYGLNKIRIKVTGAYNDTSDEIQYFSPQPTIFECDIKTKKTITLDKEGEMMYNYNVYDKQHKKVLQGVGNSIDVSELKRGKYYWQIDTSHNWTEFIKK